jgi:hypothetical protein
MQSVQDHNQYKTPIIHYTESEKQNTNHQKNDKRSKCLQKKKRVATLFADRLIMESIQG